MCLQLKTTTSNGHGGSFRRKSGLVQRGALLITHWGLSGPVVLRLSAWSARELAATNYKAQLVIDWLPNVNSNEIHSILTDCTSTWKTKQVATICPCFQDSSRNGRLPKGLWRNIVIHALTNETLLWKDLSKTQLATLSSALKSSVFKVTGKGVFKDEFVTCGGVSRKQVHFDSMESRLVPNLFFAGEVLDIDGLTGGFNLQAAWTTGYLCGQSIAKRIQRY